MKREIRLTVEVTDTATDEEIEEFFEFEFGYNDSCPNDNPFFNGYGYDVVDFELD